MIYPYKGKYPVIHPSVFLASNVTIVGDVVLDEEVNVWFGSVIRGDVHSIYVGPRTNIQDNCTLHVTWDKYSLTIGADVTIGHGAVLHGCTVHNGCLIGMGVTVLDGAVIHEESLIAAGSLIRQHSEVPDGSLVAGVPGRIIRELSNNEREALRNSAQNYLLYVNEYNQHRDLEKGMDLETYFQLKKEVIV